MFNWFRKKEKTVELSNELVVAIINMFFDWYQSEIALYQNMGPEDKCMVRNLSNLDPISFQDRDLGLQFLERYFIINNNAEQRIVPRMRILQSKLNIIFGVDVMTAFKTRCLVSLNEDYHINIELLTEYVRKSDLFWMYVLFLLVGNSDMLHK